MKFVIQEMTMIATEGGSTRFKITFTSMNGSTLVMWSESPVAADIVRNPYDRFVSLFND
jgi:hypothetical protein